MKTSPESGTSSPAIPRSSVDLPLPLGPSRAVSEPLSTSIETSSSSTKSPKRFVTLRAAIATAHRHQDEGQNCAARQHHRRRIRARLVEVLVRGLDILRQRL